VIAGTDNWAGDHGTEISQASIFFFFLLFFLSYLRGFHAVVGFCLFGLLSGSSALLPASGTTLCWPLQPTVEWGHYAVGKPAITVHSGDTVEDPDAGRRAGRLTAWLREASKRKTFRLITMRSIKDIRRRTRGPGGHILTGPVSGGRGRNQVTCSKCRS